MGAKVQPSDFVHLHNHTQYSLLDGLTKVPALIKQVESLGMGSVAMTDHGTLSGAIEFYKEAKNQGIKPIIGMEAYVAARTANDKEPGKDKLNYHLIILAMNSTGYQNLMRLSTLANLEGFYYKPRIDHSWLKEYNEGLIVLSGCIGGEVGDALRQDQYQKAKETAKWYKSVFGDRYYLEIQDHGHKNHPSKWDEQVDVTNKTLKLADELEIPCALTCDAHYLKHEDQEAHEILLCIQTGSFLTDERRMSLKEFELHVTDPKEIIKRWGTDHPELIKNTSLIAERCNVELELGQILIPRFSVPRGQTERSYLEKLVYRGLAWRYGNVPEKKAKDLEVADAKAKLPDTVLERAAYELGVIEQMNFSGYFLIIADFINWGKDQGIVFGPGRGSAAGSIISYGLKITELDPLQYDLLFERFLNPDRISMPDIDIDIQDSRRDEVIEYCIDKYGKERVANIVTFGKMAARNAVRDVARVLQVPYAEADRLAKMIPPPVQGRHIPLSTSLKDNHDLKQEYEANEQTHRVFDLAMQLEGTIRSHGVHAAGVVIAPEDIVNYVPLELAQKGVLATQYSMGPIEDIGLLKIDFLGLSNLTIIKNALRIIKKVYDKDIAIDDVSLDDAKTFELFQRGDTTGVFQFESAGMKRYLKQLKPTQFDDLIAMNALYRPGPMQWIEDFVARKHGERRITYMHPVMEPALSATYGVIVYQEQVMQISKDMCGFSGGQADHLRKAIGKKRPEELAKLKTAFIEGAINTVHADRSTMEKFWSQLEAFAAYCFPKSHASCYAMIAYQTAYLKAHYPATFMAALMTSDFDNTDRLAIEIAECKHMGIDVLPPDINESFLEFGVVPSSKTISDITHVDGVQGAGEQRTEPYTQYGEGAAQPATPQSATNRVSVSGLAGKQDTVLRDVRIRFGMAAIKNVGTAAVEEILRAREADGLFKTLEDFMARVNPRIVNRKALESLIKAGALDRFNDRSILLNNLDVIMAYWSRLQKELDSGQTDLFGEKTAVNLMARRLVFDETKLEFTLNEQLQWERDLLGLYLSQHPLSQYELFLSEQTIPLHEVTAELEGKSVTVGGAISDVREITTKSGQRMAFVKLADHFGEIELILFPNIYQQTMSLWQRDQVVVVHGKVSSRDRNGAATTEIKVLADKAELITPEQAAAYKSTGKKTVLPKVRRKTAIVPNSDVKPQTQTRIYIRLSDGQNNDLLIKLKQTIDGYQGDTEVVLVLGEAKPQQVIKLPMRMNSDQKAVTHLQELLGAANVKVQ